METEKVREIQKLVNVLNRTGRQAAKAVWAGVCNVPSAQEEMAQHCLRQYNRILDRLKELDPTVGTIFTPLEEDTRLEVVATACRQLSAYFEDELEGGETRAGRRHRHRDWGSFYETAYEAGPFKILLGRGFRDLEELGKLIRECMPPWTWEERCRPKREDSESTSGSESETESEA